MQTMQLMPSVAIRRNLELKTQPKQLLGSLPLVIVLPTGGEDGSSIQTLKLVIGIIS
jgi:hypothetical protein